MLDRTYFVGMNEIIGRFSIFVRMDVEVEDHSSVSQHLCLETGTRWIVVGKNQLAAMVTFHMFFRWSSWVACIASHTLIPELPLSNFRVTYLRHHSHFSNYGCQFLSLVCCWPHQNEKIPLKSDKLSAS